jgi:hypothetical protein
MGGWGKTMSLTPIDRSVRSDCLSFQVPRSLLACSISARATNRALNLGENAFVAPS